jgi:hypothetical protein
MTSRSKDAKTGLCRVAFTQGLFEVQTNDFGKKAWTCTLLFPKGVSLADLEALCVEAAVAEWGDKAVQMIKDRIIKSPFLDGDGPQGKSKKTGEPHNGFPGHTFIRCQSGEDYRPKLVNQKVLPITDKSELYSGCYGFAVVNAFTWDVKENGKGISFGISMFQKAKDGERLHSSGDANPEKVFETIPDEGDAPAEAKTGEGASGLFG